jgi:hypothetical protein
MRNNFIQKICAVFLFLLITISSIGCTSTNKTATKENQNTKTESVKTDSTKNEAVKNKKIINDFQGVADYIHKNDRLPDNFITKEQATKLGWNPGKDLDKVAPGKSIGGDVFRNAEKLLPDAPKRVWRECDINYNGGKRGADRILYSNDGLIYSTSDHYKTFKLLYNGK